MTAANFRRELNDIETPRIDIHVNSPGGDVFEGIAIMNAIRQHKAHIVITVDGLAASAASYIAVAGDELVMMPNSQLMIHDAWGICIGNSEDMARTAADLDRSSDNIAAVYAGKAGGDTADWRAAMKAETWYSAEEAVDAGLADRVDDSGSSDGESDAKNAFDLSMFAYAGRDAAPPPPRIAPRSQGAPPLPAEPGGNNTTTTKEDPMADLIQGLRERLGIQADAELDDDGLLAALDETLAEQAEDTGTPPPAAQASVTVPDGTVLLEKDQYDQLLGDAAAGREARTQQINERRTQIVDTAIKEGRIAPARKGHYLALMAADEEGTTDLLVNKLEKGAIPLELIGHTGGVDAAGDDSAYPSDWLPNRQRS